MAFEELLSQVGGLRRFQILHLVFILPSLMLLIPHILLENFAAAIPGHRCWVHMVDNNTGSGNETGILSEDALLRISIPLDSNLRPEKCRRFVHPQWQLLHLNGTIHSTSEADTEPCVDGWVYDQSYFPSTIVTKWDLVCDYQSLKSVVQFLLLTGMLVGGIIGGHVSDRFGRRFILRWCLLQLAITDTCAAFAPTFPVYCVLRFLAGFSSMIIISNNSLLITEWIRPNSKALVVILSSGALSIGQIILGGLAYVFRDWQTLHVVASVPFFVFFLLSRWLVESARWLIITNKLDEGLKALRKVARTNGIKNAEETLNIEVVRSTMQEELDAAQTKTTVCDLFRNPSMRKRICILVFLRFANTIPFYGTMVNLQHVGSNIFLLQVLYGAVALIVRCLALLTLNHMGRRISQILFMFLVGLSILANTFVPKEMQTLRVALACLGIGCSAATFSSVAVHFIELIPTVLRARASGIDLTASRIGAALAPLLMTLTVFFTTLPWIIYGIFPIIGGLIVFLLPETKNLPLPDTIKDVENKKNLKKKA
uniref:Solute carrier family 22 member 10 n=1 Tax=Pan troglodytes TaxID=9598 RepID=A0A2I3TWY5_PANTR